jgi:uncharacterized membrane protein YphA (DoxX/SURF4 family)
MKAILHNELTRSLVRWGLGLVFVVASIDKIAHPDVFAESILAYRLAPEALVNVFALIVPWLELVCGVFLLGGVYVRPSSVIVSTMLVVFMAAMVLAIVRGLKIDCGCFGVGRATEVGWTRVGEDLIMLAAGVYLLVVPEASEESGVSTLPSEVR